MKDNFNVNKWNKSRYLHEESINEELANLDPKLAFAIYQLIKKPLDKRAEDVGDNMSYFSEMFPTATSFYYELDGKFGNLNESLKIGDLEFGVNLPPSSRLPNPKRDVQTTIFDADSLERWKEDKDPNIEVIEKEDQYGNKSFTIPDWDEGIQNAQQGVANWLKQDKNRT